MAATTNGNQASIPIVNFGKFLDGGEEEKKQAAQEIDDAFRNAGFVYLKGHGVNKDLIKECFEWVSWRFLAFPFSSISKSGKM